MHAETVAVASDHAGVALKELLKEELAGRGYAVLDLGTSGDESVDYPDFGHALGEAVAVGKAARGVAVCGSGIGISIAANRHPGVRAALCRDVRDAMLARQHNDANVLALGGHVTAPDDARAVLKAFLETPFEGGRHARRVEKLG